MDSTFKRQFAERVTIGVPKLRATVIIPCMNEEDATEQFCESISNLEVALPEYQLFFIIVDDGSTDRSVDDLSYLLRERDNVSIIEHGVNRGVAAAIQTGIRESTTEVVCSMDFDCTYDPMQFCNLLPAMTEDIDLVTASPYHPLGQVLNVPPWRLVISKFASQLYRIAMRTNLHTYTSCFRVFRRSSIVDIELENPGFVGVAELLWQLECRGGNIVEVPAVLDVRQFGQSKLRVVEVTFAHLRLLAKMLVKRLIATGDPPKRLKRVPIHEVEAAKVHTPMNKLKQNRF